MHANGYLVHKKMLDIIRKMQVKTIMIIVIIIKTIIIIAIKKTIFSKCWARYTCKKIESLCTIGGSVFGAATMENSMEYSKN